MVNFNYEVCRQHNVCVRDKSVEGDYRSTVPMAICECLCVCVCVLLLHFPSSVITLSHYVMTVMCVLWV